MRGKPYAEFFTSDLLVPAERARMLQRGPLPKDKTLSPSSSDFNKLIGMVGHCPDAGCAVSKGSSAYVQSRVEMPGVTAAMFRWRFTWHPLEKQRYMLWFPHAHVENFVEDPGRLTDTSLTYERRLYGNPNHIEEYVGPSSLKIFIQFTNPVALGFDEALLKQSGFTSASGTLRISDAPDTTFMVMLHLARDTGREPVSRYDRRPPRFRSVSGRGRRAGAHAQDRHGSQCGRGA